MPTRSPVFPPTFVNPRLVPPITTAITSHHHHPIASPRAHLPFIDDHAPQASRRPSFQLPHVQASRSCADKQGLIFPLSPSLMLHLSFSTPVPPRLDQYYTFSL